MLLLGCSEAARRLRVHPLTLHRWHATGQLIPTAVDSEKRRLYSEEQIAEFAAKRATEKATKESKRTVHEQ